MNLKLNKSELLGSEKKENPIVTVILTILIVFMFAWLFTVSFFQLCEINGTSMEPNFHNDQFVLLNKKNNDFKTLDVVVLVPDPQYPENRLIKRVIAKEGESFFFKKPSPDVSYVRLYYGKQSDPDSEPAPETFLSDNERHMNPSSFNGKFRLNTDYTVPEGQFFFLGDNRNNSADSRSYGYCNVSQVVGKVVSAPEKGSFLENLLLFLFYSPLKSIAPEG